MTRNRKEDNISVYASAAFSFAYENVTQNDIVRHNFEIPISCANTRSIRRKSQKLHYLLIVAIHRARAFIYNAPVSLAFGIYRHSSWLTFHLHDKAA